MTSKRIRSLRARKPPDGPSAYARNVLRKCGGCANRENEQKYVASCIANLKREAELIEFLEKRIDPYDALSDEELRELGPAELDDYCHATHVAEKELAALMGQVAGLDLLRDRIGTEAAADQYWKVMQRLSPESERDYRRIDAVLRAACKPSVKNPISYLKIVLTRERAARKRMARK